MKDLMAQGWTARRIAHHLGPAFTRSSVIGKWNRMGLRNTHYVAVDPDAEKPADLPAPDIEGVHFDKLESGMCRYPLVGEGRHILFCGKDTINRVYCECHQRLTRVAGTGSPVNLKSLKLNSR
jgi:hypothetical protein